MYTFVFSLIAFFAQQHFFDCKIISFYLESSYFPNSLAFSPPLLEFNVCLMPFQAVHARKEVIIDLYSVWYCC